MASRKSKKRTLATLEEAESSKGEEVPREQTVTGVVESDTPIVGGDHEVSLALADALPRAKREARVTYEFEYRRLLGLLPAAIPLVNIPVPMSKTRRGPSVFRNETLDVPWCLVCVTELHTRHYYSTIQRLFRRTVLSPRSFVAVGNHLLPITVPLAAGSVEHQASQIYCLIAHVFATHTWSDDVKSIIDNPGTLCLVHFEDDEVKRRVAAGKMRRNVRTFLTCM